VKQRTDNGDGRKPKVMNRLSGFAAFLRRRIGQRRSATSSTWLTGHADDRPVPPLFGWKPADDPPE
jgi:hypothetical protein